MKILLLIFGLYFSFFLPELKAQKLVKEGRQWNVEEISWGANVTSFYKVEGNVVFDNVTYKQVWKTTGMDTSNYGKIPVYLREDSLNRVFEKVRDQNEHLLYDFSMSVGDTATFHDEDYNTCDYAIVSIDTIQLLNGAYAKRMNLENLDSRYEPGFLIEGIGSDYGLVIPARGGCVFDYEAHMGCVYEDGKQIYGDPKGRCYIYRVPTKEISSQDQIKIFPNPFGQTIHIDISESSQSYNSIELLDAGGRKVYQLNEPTGSIEINTGNLPNGFYILKMVAESGMVLTKRLIKS